MTRSTTWLLPNTGSTFRPAPGYPSLRQPGSAPTDSHHATVNRCDTGVGPAWLGARIVAETPPQHLGTEQTCLPGSRAFLRSRPLATSQHRLCRMRRSCPTLFPHNGRSGSCSLRRYVASRWAGCGLPNASTRLADTAPGQADARNAFTATTGWLWSAKIQPITLSTSPSNAHTEHRMARSEKRVVRLSPLRTVAKDESQLIDLDYIKEQHHVQAAIQFHQRGRDCRWEPLHPWWSGCGDGGCHGAAHVGQGAGGRH